MDKLSRIASRGSSKAMTLAILIYLWLKTLVNPVFNTTDVELANIVAKDLISVTWLEMIAAITQHEVYLPEARSDILFELGLYFPEKK